MDARDIIDNKDSIIPVVGENCFFYYPENGEEKIPLQEYIIDKLVEISKIDKKDLPVERMKKEGFHGLSLCRQLCFASDKKFVGSYKMVIKEARQCIHLDETIKEFLDRHRFHLIITTCCFDFMETELMCYESIYYEASNGANNKETLNPDGYIVYHIFGKNDNNVWTWDEERLLHTLHYLHDNDTAPDGLRRYIYPANGSTKSLLILYSNLPDWVFRFLLYPLAYKDAIWLDGVYLNNKNNDLGLKNFIEKVIEFEIEDNNMKLILDETNEMKSIEQDSEKRISHNYEFDIFISYASEDKETALKIKERLEKLYELKIWLDRKGGIEDGSYVKRMEYGIQNSAYFMPLITDAYISKLKNRVYDSSFNIEEILQEDKKAPYVQKEAWAASCHWREVKKKYPQREAYALPVLFTDTNITYEMINACVCLLGQLPENIFKEITIFEYNNSLLAEKDWGRYKTIER